MGEEEILHQNVFWAVIIIVCILAFIILYAITTKGLSLIAFSH